MVLAPRPGVLMGAPINRRSPLRYDAPAYSYPGVIHRSEETASVSVPAASVNNSAATILVMNANRISHRENTHHPATNSPARLTRPKSSPSSRAMRWSPNEFSVTDRPGGRSHYKPFDAASLRVF